MKKVLAATGVAVLALATVVSAQGYMFNANLTVGSTGPDVVALQTALMNAGFDIPAITSGAAAKGYFGSQTQAAAKLYQASRGIPNTGFVGPLTRAALNGGAASTGGTTVMCPVGYVCTPTTVGGTPVTGSPAGITTPGVAGSLAVSLQGSPSGASLDKGETEDVARYRVQASASDQQITSISLDFDNRLWLYASGITIKDDNGAIVAQRNGLNVSDFVELTVGSSYRIQLPANYVIPRTQTRFLTISISILPVTDRTSATLSLTNGSFRSVDGTGVTSTNEDTTDRTFSFTGTNTGDIVTTINASAPLQRLVQISNSAETSDVVLSVFDLKSQNRSSQLRTLKLYVNTSGTASETLFNRVKIRVGGTTYTANSVTTGSTASSTYTFSDLNISLPEDQNVSVTVLADVAKPSSNGALDGVMASTTLIANTTNVVAEDATYNSVGLVSNTIVSSNAIFSAASALVSNKSFTATGVGQTSSSYNVSFKFTITAGDSTLYVSRVMSGTDFVATSTTGSLSATLPTLQSNPGALAGDSSTEYVIPAGGSREFTISGSATGTAGATGTVKIDSIKYGTATGVYGQTINYGLEQLQTTSLTIGS